MDTITYRLAREEDTLSVAIFHDEFFEKGRSKEKVDWIWNANPAGSAICVLALVGLEVIGTQCLLPYVMMNHSGKRILTGKSDDTCVHPEYRNRGVFRNMYKYLIQEAEQKKIQAIWGFTSAIVPFRNIGFEICEPYSMAIFGSGYIETFNSLSKGMGLLRKVKVGVFLLGMIIRRTPKPVAVQNEELKDILKEIISLEQNQDFSIEMSRQYLDWRILQNPYYTKVGCLTYRESGRLVAYVAFHFDETTAYIIHDCCDQKQSIEMSSRIVAAFSREMTQLGAYVIKNWMFQNSAKAARRSKFIKDAGYCFAKTGSHFVWLPLNEQISIERKELYLSRIASLGTT